MSEDLTKLSGPELAAELERGDARDCVSTPLLLEAARRLREDDRVAMRNLERERDGLRATVVQLQHECDLSAAQVRELEGEIMAKTKAARTAQKTWNGQRTP